MSAETGHVNNLIAEARRQVEICNACRYCEGYCSVFPAITRQRSFADADVVQLANLCHNCRGCYYACQFTPPHEFDLNLPRALADVRQATWQDHAVPASAARLFQRSGVAIALALVAGLALLIYAIKAIGAASGGVGFYAVLSHSAMVAIFTPAFIAPLIIVAVGVRRYWRDTRAGPFQLAYLWHALRYAATMRDLSGGHGEGCNFEDEDRFSSARRWHHQLVMWGFTLCFAATSVATVMHYVLDWPAPYGFWTLPKLLGVVGGLMLSVGSAGLVWLKTKADPKLGAADVYGGEMGFVLLLFLVSTSGLGLYVFGGTSWLTVLLAVHLGSVFAFFILTPYTKMVHGFYRVAALCADAASQMAAKR
jgi:citrate/tricarballylate utilization protein